jgi:thiol-disulfide isomerase/thioredoxin
MSREYDPSIDELTDQPTARPRRPLPTRPVAPPGPVEDDAFAYEYEAEEPPRRNTAMVVGILGMGGLIALVLLVLIYNNLNKPAVTSTAAGSQGTVLEDVTTGSVAVDFTAQTLDGQTVQLSSYRGKNPVWVNFWASWCAPCKAEMPDMEELYQAYKGQGLVMLGYDVAEPEQTVRDFVTSRGFTWTFLLDNGVTATRYQTTGIPTHVFINKQGIITHRISSGLPKEYMEEQIKSLLAQ